MEARAIFSIGTFGTYALLHDWHREQKSVTCSTFWLIYTIDGAHMSVEDFVYFHLPPVDAWPHCQNTTFGISCYRQMNTAVNQVALMISHALNTVSGPDR